MAAVIYLLCAFTTLICAVLLLRANRHRRSPLLFWSGLCFAFLTLDNLLLFIDRILLPTVDLSIERAPTALIGVGLLLYALIWKTE